MNLCLLSVIPFAVAYVPERTAIRNKIFFGITDTPAKAQNIAAPSGIIMLPPASSQFGVNKTASHDTDLNDYGSLGVPGAELLRRSEVSQAAGESGDNPPRNFFEYQAESKATETVRHMLDVFSVFWLIVIVVACYFFLKAALVEANKTVTIPLFKRSDNRTTHAAAVAQKRKENMRIDREAYVYVDGG
jgi:hypothetical protein